MSKMNPQYPYTPSELAVKRYFAETLLRLARDQGKLHFPAAVIEAENLKLIERMETENAA